jgi:hypothetical protein
MQGVGKCRIEFGPKADQAGRVGCGKLENTRKSGGRCQQAGPVAGLRTGFATTRRKFGRGHVAKRLQQKAAIRVSAIVRIFAQQR